MILTWHSTSCQVWVHNKLDTSEMDNYRNIVIFYATNYSCFFSVWSMVCLHCPTLRLIQRMIKITCTELCKGVHTQWPHRDRYQYRFQFGSISVSFTVSVNTPIILLMIKYIYCVSLNKSTYKSHITYSFIWFIFTEIFNESNRSLTIDINLCYAHEVLVISM